MSEAWGPHPGAGLTAVTVHKYKGTGKQVTVRRGWGWVGWGPTFVVPHFGCCRVCVAVLEAVVEGEVLLLVLQLQQLLLVGLPLLFLQQHQQC